MFRGVMMLIGAGVAVAMAGAQEGGRRSPFMPPSSQAAAPVVETAAPIEFHGVIVIAKQHYFNFFEPGKRVSTWVKKDEPGAPIVVKSYNEDAETITVEHGGRSMNLALQKMKVAAAPMPVSPVMTAPASATPIEQPPVVLNPTAADEAKRLDAIAAEVRRRRLMRQQTTPPGTPATAPKQ